MITFLICVIIFMTLQNEALMYPARQLSSAHDWVRQRGSANDKHRNETAALAFLSLIFAQWEDVETGRPPLFTSMAKAARRH